MEVLRSHSLSRIFSLFTGVIFLNMGFFLAEVSLLDLNDRQMIENVCNLVLNGGLEEERDAHAPGTDGPGKAFSLMNTDILFGHGLRVGIALKMNPSSEDLYPNADHSQKVSQPPEHLVPFLNRV